MSKREAPDTRHKQLNLLADSLNGYVLQNDDSHNLSPIGKGGSGIVYKARQKFHGETYVDRAIKFFIYEDKILEADSDKKPISEEDFISEIANITKFNHQSLIKVVDAGIHDCDAGKVPYLVTDFIPGPTLEEVIEGESGEEIRQRFLEDLDLILDFLLDIARGIKHIHDRGYAHCDIAPKNVFIQLQGDSICPILGDLGIARSMKKEAGITIRIVGSRKWMSPEAEKYCDKEVDYSVFSLLQPHWDIYSFARTGLKLLEIFGEEKPRSWHASLQNDLEKACEKSEPISIDNLIDRVEFLKPINREVAKIPELSMGVGSGRRKMMPVEALTTSKRLNQLIQHPALLRLAFVPQLTTASQVFSGANHTRYEHMLGVVETMRRYLLSLLDESEFLLHLSSEKIELALLASALSCATRFPLSNVVHEIRYKDNRLFSDFSKHSLYKEMMHIKDSEGQTFQDFIRSEFRNVGISDVLKVLCAETDKFDDADKLIDSLLNNSLDVRVIDFVRRDSHHLGVNSGDSFSIEEILPHVTIHKHRLALKIEGVSVAEQIILLRYWLFSRVYWNQPNRIFCAMARVVLLELYSQDGFAETFRKEVLSLDQRGMIDCLVAACEKYELEKHKDIAARLYGREHNLYKGLFNSSRVDYVFSLDLFDNLENISVIQMEELTVDISNKLKEGGVFSSDNVLPIIIDIPVEPGSIKMGGDVEVKLGEEKFKKLGEISGIIKGTAASFNQQLSKFRVFHHPSFIISDDQRALAEKVIIEAVKQFFRANGK